MANFLSSQIDYILFFHGLGVLVLGIVLWGVNRVDSRNIPWKWVIAGTFSQVIYLWMFVLGFSFESSSLYSYIARVFEAISYVFLFEFSTQLCKGIFNKTLPRIIIISLCAGVLFFACYGLSEFRLAINYLLRFTSVLFLSFVLYFYRRKYLKQSFLLLSGNILLSVYSIWIFFKPLSEPASINDSFANTIAGFIVFFLAYEFELERLRLIGRFPIKKENNFFRFTSFFVPVLLVIALLGGYFVYTLSENRFMQFRQQFLLQTASVAGILEARKIEDEVIKETKTKNNSYFNRVDEIFHSLDFSNRYFVLGLNSKGEIHKFETGSRLLHKRDYSEKNILEAFSEQIRSVYLSGQAEILGPYWDAEREWIISLVPLKRHTTEPPFALLAIERSMDGLNQMLFRFRFILIFAVGVAVIPFVLFWTFQNQSLEEQIERILKAEKMLARQKTLQKISQYPMGQINDYFSFVNQTVASVIELDKIAIWLFSSDRKKLICRDMFIFKEKEHRALDEIELLLHPHLLKEMSETRSFLSSPDHDDNRLKGIRHKLVAAEDVHSLMIIPLKLGGKLQGIITFARLQNDKEWDLEEQEFASSVSDVVALYTENYELEKLRNEKKHLEGQFIQSTKLMAVGTLASGVAHEINNPLSIIRGYLESTKDTIAHVNGLPKVWERLSIAAERIEKIVKGLRLYSQNSDESIKSCVMSEVITHSVMLLKPLYICDQIAIGWESHLSGVSVVGNPGRLQEVLVNILSNARDALNGVERERKIILAEEIIGNDYILTISDNGEGISSNILPRVFDPFFTTKSPGKGTGLGLYTAHSTVRSYGGEIKIESHIGQGTQVQIILPLAAECTNPAYKLNANSRTLRNKMKILVVDDEQDVREIIAEYLQKRDFIVAMAGDGQEGLELLKTQHFDVVITDIKMPRMRGDKFIQEAKKFISPTVRFIVMTGGVEWEDEKNAVDLADHQLRKPFEFKQLYQIIRDYQS